MYFACAEHIEQAIDEFVEQYEVSPDLNRIESTVTETGILAHCRFCARLPSYRLSAGVICS